MMKDKGNVFKRLGEALEYIEETKDKWFPDSKFYLIPSKVIDSLPEDLCKYLITFIYFKRDCLDFNRYVLNFEKYLDNIKDSQYRVWLENAKYLNTSDHSIPYDLEISKYRHIYDCDCRLRYDRGETPRKIKVIETEDLKKLLDIFGEGNLKLLMEDPDLENNRILREIEVEVDRVNRRVQSTHKKLLD